MESVDQFRTKQTRDQEIPRIPLPFANRQTAWSAKTSQLFKISPPVCDMLVGVINQPNSPAVPPWNTRTNPLDLAITKYGIEAQLSADVYLHSLLPVTF